MPILKKILRLAVKALAVLVVFFGLIWAATQFFSRQEKALAQDFLDLLQQGEFSNAYEYFSAEAKAEVPLNLLQVEFERLAKDYSALEFLHISISTRMTTLHASATTPDGCTSQFSFYFIGEKIQHFNIQNVCFDAEFNT